MISMPSVSRTPKGNVMPYRRGLAAEFLLNPAAAAGRRHLRHPWLLGGCYAGEVALSMRSKPLIILVSAPGIEPGTY